MYTNDSSELFILYVSVLTIHFIFTVLTAIQFGLVNSPTIRYDGHWIMDIFIYLNFYMLLFFQAYFENIKANSSIYTKSIDKKLTKEFLSYNQLLSEQEDVKSVATRAVKDSLKFKMGI